MTRVPMAAKSDIAADLKLSEILEQIAAFFREVGDEAAEGQAAELIQKLREEQIQIVVMGEFKRGKSSLINAFLGKAILPVASVPLTAVVTVVKAGEREAATVEFLDGRRREIDISEVEDYVSEDRNHKNAKSVDRVVVETVSPFLSGGTLLIDTPGTGSVYRHNTEVTQKYIPNCDAVIFVLASDPPISESEVEFLHSVRRWAKKLFVVQNKIDYLSAADLAHSVAFTEKVLREALGDLKATPFPVSAKIALKSQSSGDQAAFEKSGLPALMGALQALLEQEKRAIVRDSVWSKARGILDRKLVNIDLELGTLKASAQGWDKTAKNLKASLEGAKRKQYDFAKLYQAELKDQVKAMEEALYARVATEGRRIVKDIEKLYAEIKDEPVANIRAELNRSYLNAVEDFFTRFLLEEEPRWRSQFKAMTNRYLDDTVLSLNSVLSDAASALGVSHRPLSKPAISVDPPALWFILEEVSIWSGGIQSTPTLRIFKSFFWRALQRKIAESMDVNAGRLRYDYSQRIERAGTEVAGLIQGFFESSISILKQAVLKAAENRSVSEGEVSVRVVRLKDYQARLSALAEEFAL